MALFLLAGGQDHRRARELRVVERAHRVPKPGRDVDVAGDQSAGGAAKTVGDGNHQAFLHRHHVSQIGVIPQRMHDRQFGGAGIAEQMGNSLVLEQCKEGRAPSDAILHFVSSRPRPLTCAIAAPDQT